MWKNTHHTMDSSLVATLTNQIVTFVSTHIADRLHTVVQEAIDNGQYSSDTIKNELSKMLAELPRHTTSTTNTSNQSTSNTSVGKGSSSSKTSADVLKDDAGNPIRCQAVVKKTGAACKNNAKFKVGDQCVCGLHAKSAGGAQPDATKKAGGNKTNTKATSTFSAVVGGGSTAGSNPFGSFQLDDSGIDDESFNEDDE